MQRLKRIREIFGDLWSFHDAGKWVCITTNSQIANGKAVMGAGIAKQASERFPGLSIKLAEKLQRSGANIPFMFDEFRLFSFPTKNHWINDSDINLIASSAKILNKLVEDDVSHNFDVDGVYLPKVGCNNGHLNWLDVRKVLNRTLNPDVFTVVDLK